jgi:flagellar basal body P-ring formation protein FlgA
MKRFLILASWLALAAPALAGQTVTLKAETVDSDGTITLDDLFDGAGSAGDIVVAQRTGATTVLDAAAVRNLARRAGLDWDNTEGIRRIVVRAGAAGPSGAMAGRGNVEVLTYSRSLAVGDVVQPQDVVWAKAAGVPDDAPSDAAAVIGLAAKRPLRAGAAVSARDVSAQQVIKAGDLVTVTYENEGMSLSMQGKAMATAGLGELVEIQNPTSKKVVQALATGPGQALVGPAADRQRASRHTQVAYR